MTHHLRTLLCATLASLAAAPALAAKDVVFAVASTFTTTDPYDANDTLSQAMAKSFYEGMFGFDKDMKLIPVLAEGYEVSKDGLVYTIKLKRGIKFPRRHRLQGRRGEGEPRPRHESREQAEALRPLQQQHREDRGGRRLHGAHHAEDAVLPVHRAARASVHGDDQPAALKQWGSKDIAFHPVGTGPFKFVEWKATDYLKVAKFDGYWRKGYPKVDTITWKPVVDNNTRAAMMQTGEAHFTFPVSYEVADVLKARPELEVVAAPSIVLRYLSMNTQQKPFDNPKVGRRSPTRSTRRRSPRSLSTVTRRLRTAWHPRGWSTR
jgi:glutathione transport system substrate-binding protein